MFTIDCLTWDVPCDITRISEMTASDISGLMLDKSYFNDVLGQYLSYTIKIAVPVNMSDVYAGIYDALTNPVDGHFLRVPYNRDMITITARIANVSDVYVRMANGGVHWKGIQFTAISNYPSKTKTRDEVVVAGRAPLPPVSNPSEGDTYTYTSSGWVPSETYVVADDNYY